MSTAIVVMAHGRPQSLARLLASIAAADISSDTPLEISVDPGAERQHEVVDVAQRFDWPFGSVDVVVADQPLGLVQHFLTLGDRAADRGDFVLLEDDLEAGPGFATWVDAALAQYRDEVRVGGVSLNALWFDGFDRLPLDPVLDGTDAFFAQVPWYQGMGFTPQWWRDWRRFVGDDSAGQRADTSIQRGVLPSAYGELGDEEWFGDMAAWLGDTQRSFVFPRRSHSTNHGEPGVHFAARSSWFQTPVERRSSTPRLAPFAASLARYDSWLEYDAELLAAACPDLPQDLVVDLGGRRSCLDDEALLLTTQLTSQPRRTWGTERRPLIANVLDNTPGTGIALTAAGDLETDRLSLRAAAARRRDHAAHFQPQSIRQRVGDRVARRLRGDR